MAENEKFEQYRESLNRILQTMFTQLGLDGRFTFVDRGTKISVKIASGDPGRVIGRKGVMLDSMQLLVNRMLFKLDNECPQVFLDIDGYADGDKVPADKRDGESGDHARNHRRSGGRERMGGADAEQLAQQARDAAKEVKRWGEPVILPEMNPRDRRIIHITLKDDPEVTTESQGEGTMKKVVVSLVKPETSEQN